MGSHALHRRRSREADHRRPADAGSLATGSHELKEPAPRVVRRLLEPAAAAAPIVDLAAHSPLRAVLTTAAAGDMSDPAARLRLCREIGVAPERLRRVAQRHTRRVLVADSAATDTAADGMIAGEPEEVLCVTVADCLPIFLIPRDRRFPALLHSGWRGTGIVDDAFASLKRHFGRRADAYDAVIGPGIGPCCYDVPAERAHHFRDRFGADAAEVTGGSRRSGGSGRIDLRAANVALLSRAGVVGITVYDDCTACSPALISFRAERASGRDGSRRMAALLGKLEG